MHGNNRILSVLVSIIILASAGLARGECLSPGDLVDLRTPEFLRDVTPNLFVLSEGREVAVQMISSSEAKIRFRVPTAGLPWGFRFRIVHRVSGNEPRLVARGQMCDALSVEPPSPNPTPPNTVPAVSSTNPERPEAPSGPSVQMREVQGFSQIRPFRATRDDVVAPSGEPEVILIGTSEQVARAHVELSRVGVAILRNQSLGSLNIRISAVDLRGRISLDQAKALLAKRNITVVADRHNVYRAAQSGRVYANALVGVPALKGCRLARPVRVGLIDGPIDTQSPSIAGLQIVTNSVLGPRERLGSTDHATGLAALIAGNETADLPAGLAQGAQLFSVVAFSRSGGRDIAKLENVAKGLDWLVSRGVEVVDLSLAGPANDTLAEVIRRAAERGVIMVAAAGNNGRSTVSYPASDANVFAITAVDIRKRKYNRANSGPEISFAAPGVDILLPKRRGVAFRSGTSFAAAIATGVIAQELSHSALTANAMARKLRDRTVDLGQSGKDPVFGWGLIQATACSH